MIFQLFVVNMGITQSQESGEWSADGFILLVLDTQYSATNIQQLHYVEIHESSCIPVTHADKKTIKLKGMFM